MKDLLSMQKIIEQCDADFNKRLFDIADAIAANKVKIVSLSGPTCSGKTTAAAMLAERLGEDGRRVHIVSIDDFYYDREYLDRLSKKKGDGIVDYDSVDTIDLAALEVFVSEAISGVVVHCPVFDFKTGRRSGYRSIDADEGDIFIFEGIQAIYPRITALFEPHGFEGIYIAPMTALRNGDAYFEPNELRLLRRLVRDSNFRNTDAQFTLQMWDSVRQNEEKNIFPYVGNCDYKIDSTQPYELDILKPYLERILADVGEDSPQYAKASAILGKIAHIQGADSSAVGLGSLYKEFV